MVKSVKENVKEELRRQDNDVYGDESESGSSPDTEQIQNETVKERLEDVIGNKPSSNKAFSLADEVDKDEESSQDE
jgi:hypothetical protein